MCFHANAVDTGTNKLVSTRDSDLESRGRDKQDTARFLFVVGVLNEMETCLFGGSVAECFHGSKHFTGKSHVPFVHIFVVIV